MILLISQNGDVIQFESVEAVAKHLGNSLEVTKRHLATERFFNFKKIKHVLIYESEVLGLFEAMGVSSEED